MSLRERINAAVKEAMKGREMERLATLRLINAAIKDRDIAARGEGSDEPVDDAAIVALLGRMVHQRQESARMFLEGARAELAEKEQDEIRVIEEFLPRQLSPAEADRAIAEAIAETGATSLRDIGKVMAVLKARHAGQMDFGAAGGVLRTRLA